MRFSWQRTRSQIEILARPDAAWAELVDDLSLDSAVTKIPLLCWGWNFRLLHRADPRHQCPTESREPSDKKQQTGLKSLKTQAPSGGPFGIDQEVVTLRGLSRQLPGQGPQDRSPRMTTFARPTRCLHLYSPASVRTVARRRMRPEPRLEQPALSLSHLTWS